MTEAVSNQMHFKNLLMLFLCTKLGPTTDPIASLAQRRILNKLVNTLTVGKANLIVSDDIGALFIACYPKLPTSLQRLTINLLQKATS